MLSFNREQKVKRLRDKKEALIAACLKEDGKSAELALKAKMFSSGEYNPASMVSLNASTIFIIIQIVQS